MAYSAVFSFYPPGSVAGCHLWRPSLQGKLWQPTVRYTNQPIALVWRLRNIKKNIKCKCWKNCTLTLMNTLLWSIQTFVYFPDKYFIVIVCKTHIISKSASINRESSLYDCLQYITNLLEPDRLKKYFSQSSDQLAVPLASGQKLVTKIWYWQGCTMKTVASK